MKNNFEIRINGKTVKTLADLESLNLSKEEKERLASELMDIATTLMGRQEIDKLPAKKQNQFLLALLAKSERQRAVDKISLDFHGRMMGAAAADWLLNPDPTNVHSVHGGKGLDFSISIKDILVVKSGERQKSLYLCVPARPKDGGKEHTILYLNSQDTNFKTALWALQKNQHFLQQVSRSIAINLFHYKLEGKKQFVLITEAPKNFPEKLKTVTIDKTFDSKAYHKRLVEIGRLVNYHKDFPVNRQKLEEIQRYIKTHDITL